jgi:hypothetical protein
MAGGSRSETRLPYHAGLRKKPNPQGKLGLKGRHRNRKSIEMVLPSRDIAKAAPAQRMEESRT